MSEFTPLPTNLVDDELAPSNERRRYRMINNGDGTYSFEDVTTYTTVGSNYGATQINAQNEVINQLNEDLKDIHDYSSEEKLIGKWFNENLYCKSFQSDSVSTASIVLDNALNSSNANLIKVDQVYKLVNNRWTSNYDFFSGGIEHSVSVNLTASNLSIGQADSTIYGYRVTVFYTKIS